MGKKLFIGGISYSSSEDTLREAFAQCGTVVSSAIIMDRATGRSKGFGFIEMATDAEAQTAIDMWNGKDLDGRKIIVNEAKPQAPREGGFNRGGGSF